MDHDILLDRASRSAGSIFSLSAGHYLRPDYYRTLAATKYYEIGKSLSTLGILHWVVKNLIPSCFEEEILQCLSPLSKVCHSHYLNIAQTDMDSEERRFF